MPRFAALVLLLLVALPPAGRADEQAPVCLTREERRQAIASGQLVKLSAAIRSVKGRAGRDVIRARLCRGPNGLVYVLTLLGRDGKVTRATVDATDGAVVGARPTGG